jgi:hypothetical protein
MQGGYEDAMLSPKRHDPNALPTELFVIVIIWAASLAMPAWVDHGGSTTIGVFAFVNGFVATALAFGGPFLIPFDANATSRDWIEWRTYSAYSLCWMANLAFWPGIIAFAGRFWRLSRYLGAGGVVLASCFPMTRFLDGAQQFDLSWGYFVWLACPTLLTIASCWRTPKKQ